MLTNAAAKAAGAQSRAYKLFDQGGLHLFVAVTGTKSWRLKYRWKGREKLLTIGRFPDVSIAQARIRAAEAKDCLARGIDPAASSSGTEKMNSIEAVARSWYRHGRPSWSKAHAADVIGSLERHVFPAIGTLAIDAVTPPELLNVMRSVEKRGTLTTAQRLRQRLSEIFGFAIAEGLTTSDPAARLGAAMREAPPAQPHPALTDIGECRELLAACELLGARPSTLLASRFLALTAVRLEALRGMRWEEVDLKARIWTVPAARMKLARAKKEQSEKGEARFDHQVPLSAAAIAVLQAARENGHDAHSLVFPGRSAGMPIGEGALRELYIRAGYARRHVPHGWRATFSTIMNEDLGEGWRTAIDMALAHSAKGKVEGAYNRAQLLDARRQVFDRWGELLFPQP